MGLEKRSPFLLNLLLFLTFDLMLLGAGVRTMDAGLTCPDWPLCFGKAVPEYHFGVYLEFIHRVIAGLVGIIYVVFFIQVWRRPSLSRLRFLSCIGLFFLVAQIIMGGLTVLKLLDAYIVTMHLSLATVFLLTLAVMKHKLISLDGSNKPERKRLSQRWFRGLTLITLGFVLVQIFLGGLVASTYSGLVCIDFPTCNGKFFPEMMGPIAIQMVHRFGAYWLSLLVLTVVAMAVLKGSSLGLSKSQRRLSLMLLVIICCQILVGVLNLKFLMPAYLSVLHLALALILMLNVVRLHFSLKAKVGDHSSGL